jgi:hypothetical protein
MSVALPYVFASWLMYGALELPMICEYEWFSITIQTTCVYGLPPPAVVVGAVVLVLGAVVVLVVVQVW